MKKEQVLIGLGVATAMVTAFNGHAQADEVVNKHSTKSTVNQSETKKDADVSESDVKNAEIKLNQTIEEEKNAQKLVDKMQQEYTSTVTNKNKADDALKQAQKFAKQASPEKIKNVEKDLVAKQVTVKKTEDRLAGAKQDEKQAQASVEKQETVVNKVKTQVAQRAVDVKKAQNKVTEAEKAFDWNTLREIQQATDKLDAKVKANQNKVSSLASSVSKTEQERKALIERGNKTRSTLEKNLKSAGDEFHTVTVSHEIKSNSVSESESKTPPLDEKTFVGRDGKTNYVAANEDVNFSGERTETIVVKSKDDIHTPHVVDYKKVSEYVRNYLIELRRINGIDIPVPPVTEKALKYGKARADEMVANDKLSHDTKLKNQDFGFKDATENATAGSVPEKSRLSEKELAYKELLSYFNDYSNASLYGASTPKEANTFNYGHRIPLLAASGTGFALGASSSKKTTFGNYGVMTFISEAKGVYDTLPTVISPSEKRSYVYNGKTYYYNPSSSYFLARAENKDGDPDHSEFYFNGKRVKFLPKTTFRYVWNEITYPKNPAYTKAKEALDSFNRKQKNEETLMRDKISSLNKNLTIAKTTLNTDQKNLDKTKKRLADLTKQNQSKLNVLKSAKSELSKQQTALNIAKSELSKQESQLNRLKAIKNNKSHASKNAEQSLLNVKNDLLKAQQYVLVLKNAPRKLEEAKKSLMIAKQKLEEFKKALENANAKLKNAKVKKEAAKKEYIKVSEALKVRLASKGSWIQSSGRWWYRHNNGSYTSNGWELINGKWYHFDRSGWMQTGWVQSGSSWYYLSGSGDMQTGWVKSSGSWYYLNSSGSMQTGWFAVSGKWYYAYSSGALAVNTTTPDGYHVNYNGEWIK
jgi:choline binding protein J